MPSRFISLVFIITITLPLSNLVQAESEVIDSIAAIVDDNIILESEISYGVSTLLLEQRVRFPTESQVAELREHVYEAYITQKILLAQAIDETLNVEDRVVDRELNRKFDALVNQIGSQEKLVDYFGKSIRAIKREMRKGVRDGLLIDMLKQRHIIGVRVRRKDIIDFYEKNISQMPIMPEQVGLSMILLSVEPSEEARSSAFERINMVRNLLLAGADFDSVAREHSDDPSANNGGRLGFTTRGDLVTQYEETAYALEPGQFSEIVESRYGLHIIRLVERQGERISTQHILVKLAPTENDWQRVRDSAWSLRDRVSRGESFAEIAKQYSVDEETAPSGGVLDIISVDALPVEFRDVLSGMKVGEVSEPFNAVFGVNMIRLDKRTAERKFSLSQDWQTIEAYALANKRELVFIEWVQSLKKDHYIWPDREVN